MVIVSAASGCSNIVPIFSLLPHVAGNFRDQFLYRSLRSSYQARIDGFNSGNLPILLSKLSPQHNYRFSWKPTRRTPFPARTPFYRIPSELNEQVASVSRHMKLFELIFSHGLYFETEDPVNDQLVMKCGSIRECCQWFMVYLFSFAVQIPSARGAHPSRKACKFRGMKVAARPLDLPCESRVTFQGDILNSS